jgi:hypothetical protein
LLHKEHQVFSCIYGILGKLFLINDLDKKVGKCYFFTGMIDFKNKLNESQFKAVVASEGAVFGFGW